MSSNTYKLKIIFNYFIHFRKWRMASWASLKCNNDPGTSTPYVIAGDDTFCLGMHLLNPYNLLGSYQEQVSYYHLSQARRMCENIVGILANRFHIFLGIMDLMNSWAILVTYTAVMLHNLLCSCNPLRYMLASSVGQENTDGSVGPGTWCEQPDQMQRMDGCSA